MGTPLPSKSPKSRDRNPHNRAKVSKERGPCQKTCAVHKGRGTCTTTTRTLEYARTRFHLQPNVLMILGEVAICLVGDEPGDLIAVSKARALVSPVGAVYYRVR
jgi:hypothetical protein